MRGKTRTALVAAILAGAPATAHAGGLFLPGIGPTSLSRAGAFVASADDPSALGVNPAGLAKTEGVAVMVGANFVDYSMEFVRRGSYDSIDDAVLPWEGQSYEEAYGAVTDGSDPAIGIGGFQAVPMIVVAIDLEKQVKGLHLGVGLVAPSAYPVREYDSEWTINEDDEVRAPPPSRYDTVEQEAAVILPSIGVGYRINDQLDVGARFSWGIANLNATSFTWGEVNREEWTGSDAVFHVESSDPFVPVFALGALYRPSDKFEVGFDWVSQASVHAKGIGSSTQSNDLELTPGEPVVIEPAEGNAVLCEAGGEIGRLKTCVDIALPMITTVGGRYILRDAAGGQKGDVELNVAWERWSAVSNYHVTVDGVVLDSLHLKPSDIRHNLRDVLSFRLGGSYQLPVGDGLIVRGGVAHDTAAAKEGWERLDFDGAARTTLSAGVAYPVGKVTVAVGGGYVHEGTREVGGDCNTSTPDVPGCGPGGEEEPLDSRVGPDPIQPLNAGDAFQSPFNAGTYKSGYVVMHLGVIARF